MRQRVLHGPRWKLQYGQAVAQGLRRLEEGKRWHISSKCKAVILKLIVTASMSVHTTDHRSRHCHSERRQRAWRECIGWKRPLSQDFLAASKQTKTSHCRCDCTKAGRFKQRQTYRGSAPRVVVKTSRLKQQTWHSGTQGLNCHVINSYMLLHSDVCAYTCFNWQW
jgi:hypothetical protein